MLRPGARRLQQFFAAAGMGALSCAMAQPTLAAETAWQDVAPGARMRLITSDQLGADRTTLIGLELDMPATTKTYWRQPGETGIPIQLDFGASHGLAATKVRWPYPVIDDTGGYHDYVYFGRLVLPVELTLQDRAASLDVKVVLGICEDICIPASAEFSLPLEFSHADAGNALRLRQALADVPLPWGGSDAFDLAYDPTSKTLQVRLPAEEIAPHSVIVDIAGSPILFGAPQKSPDGLVLLPLLGGGEPAEGQRVTVTFDTPRGPFEVEKPLVVRSTQR